MSYLSCNIWESHHHDNCCCRTTSRDRKKGYLDTCRKEVLSKKGIPSTLARNMFNITRVTVVVPLTTETLPETGTQSTFQSV